MTRMLSLAVVFAVTALLIPALSVSGQDSDLCEKCPAQKCTNCHAIEFELVGVDFPLAGSECDAKPRLEADPEENEIAIEIAFGCDIPFRNNLPFLSHRFRTIKSEDCEVTLIGEQCKGASSNAKGSTCCEQCGHTCCAKTQDEVNLQMSCGGGVPFLSNIPYVNGLFKNVGITTRQATEECQDSDCATKCVTAGCCGGIECGVPACRANALVRLANHVREVDEDEGRTRHERMQELIELRVENERLQVQVEAMEHHIELMSEMAEVKAENAGLKARLDLMEKHAAHATFIHARTAATAHGSFVVPGLPLPCHAQHANPAPANVPANLRPPVSTAAVHGKVKSPATPHAAIIDNHRFDPAYMQRLTEQIRALQWELNKQRHESSRLKPAGDKTRSN